MVLVQRADGQKTTLELIPELNMFIKPFFPKRRLFYKLVATVNSANKKQERSSQAEVGSLCKCKSNFGHLFLPPKIALFFFHFNDRTY